MTIYISPDGYETIKEYSLIANYKDNHVIKSQRIELQHMGKVIQEFPVYMDLNSVESVKIIRHKQVDK